MKIFNLIFKIDRKVRYAIRGDIGLSEITGKSPFDNMNNSTFVFKIHDVL